MLFNMIKREMSFNIVFGNWEWKIFLLAHLPNHGGQNLRSVLQVSSLGKVTNHFWKVKSKPDCSKILQKLQTPTVDFCFNCMA